MKPFLSIIIPAYNEERRLPLTLLDIDKRLSVAEYSYEILVVSDGSSDSTVPVAKRMTEGIKNLRVIDNKENRGKGWVVRQGMLDAGGEWRLFMDADNSTSIDQFEHMREFIKEGYEVIIGSRAIMGAELDPPQPWHKQLLGKLGNLFIQFVILPGIKDTQCGFKCFSEKATTEIFSLTRVYGWGFDVEALVLARKLGYRVIEMPVFWVNDSRSKVSFGSYFSTLFEVIRIKINFLRNTYRISK